MVTAEPHWGQAAVAMARQVPPGDSKRSREERRRKPIVHKAQALARRRDSSLKHADEPCPGAFKPIAIPAVAAAVTVGARLERRKRAERDTPAILRDDDFVD